MLRTGGGRTVVVTMAARLLSLIVLLLYCADEVCPQQARAQAQAHAKTSRTVINTTLVLVRDPNNPPTIETSSNSIQFVLHYEDVYRWREVVDAFVLTHTLDVNTLRTYTQEQLIAQGFAQTALGIDPTNTQTQTAANPHMWTGIDTFDISTLQLQAAVYWNQQRLLISQSQPQTTPQSSSKHSRARAEMYPLFVGVNYPSTPSPLADIFQLQCFNRNVNHDGNSDDDNDAECKHTESNKHTRGSMWPPFLYTNKQAHTRVLLYQNIGANTGGTIAIELLRDEIERVGLDVVLCSEHNILTDDRCGYPRGLLA
jgi:hypothetical protein